MRTKDWLALIGFIALSQGAGIVGSLFTTPSIQGWYATLARPQVAPPDWIFAPVWTTLFLLMGIAAFLVWRNGWYRQDVRRALGVFWVQLACNTLWSIIFFGLHDPGVAFVEIIVLWLAIAATIYLFARISRLAAWLLVPYILWVSFASYLNYLIWILNS